MGAAAAAAAAAECWGRRGAGSNVSKEGGGRGEKGG